MITKILEQNLPIMKSTELDVPNIFFLPPSLPSPLGKPPKVKEKCSYHHNTEQQMSPVEIRVACSENEAHLEVVLCFSVMVFDQIGRVLKSTRYLQI